MTGLSSPDGAITANVARIGTWTQWFMRRRLLFAGAIPLMGGGMALNWRWRTAIGSRLFRSLWPPAPRCAASVCA